MKKTLAVGIFVTLFLFFIVLQANAIGGNGIMTIDKPLSPPKGKGGTEVTIYGHDFGIQNSGSYVKFSDYLDMEIKSWTDGKIQFLVPTKIEVLNAPKNFITRLPIIGDVAKLMIQIAPIKFAGEATGGEDIVSVSITNRIGRYIIESNKVDFQYTPSDPTPSSQKQALVNIRNLVVDPLRATRLFFKDYLFCFCSNETKQKYLENSMNDIVRWSAEYVAKPATQVLGLKLSQNVAETTPTTPQTPTQNPKITPEPQPSNNAQWKTIDKNLFSIRMPEKWNEVASPNKDSFADSSEQLFPFQGNAGEYFEIIIDPTPRGGGCTDADWELKASSSGDRVVIEKEKIAKSNDEMCGDTHSDGKLNIKAFAKDSNSQNIPLQGHVYYFFFGNDQKETGVDTQVFKDILASFHAKSEQQTPKNNPPETKYQPSSGAPSTDIGQKSKKLTVQLLDQYGIPVTTLIKKDSFVYSYMPSMYLLDAVGDKISGEFCSPKGCDIGPQNESSGIWELNHDIPYGKYTIVFIGGECCESSGRLSREWSAFKKEISISNDNERFAKALVETKVVKIPIHFNVRLVNQIGTPIEGGDEMFGFPCYLADKSGKMVSSVSAMGGDTCVASRDLNYSKPLPSGDYILRIKKRGYLPFEKTISIPDVSALNDNKAYSQIPEIKGNLILIKNNP